MPIAQSATQLLEINSLSASPRPRVALFEGSCQEPSIDARVGRYRLQVVELRTSAGLVKIVVGNAEFDIIGVGSFVSVRERFFGIGSLPFCRTLSITVLNSMEGQLFDAFSLTCS